MRLPNPRRTSRGLLATRWGRCLSGAVALLALVTAVGLVVLWPHGEGPSGRRLASTPTVEAKVAAVSEQQCPGPYRQTCRSIEVRIEEGADRGRREPILLGPANVSPTVDAGDGVRVQRAAGDPNMNVQRYGFTSVDRGRRCCG